MPAIAAPSCEHDSIRHNGLIITVMQLNLPCTLLVIVSRLIPFHVSL